MSTRKLFRGMAAVCLALMLLCLSACGGKAEPPAVPAPEPPAQAETPAPPETSAPPEAPAQQEASSQDESITLPFEQPLELVFSSGAGAWRSILVLSPDGTFTGEYSDSDMGSTGEGYPHGTCYVSVFQGRFGDIRQVDDTTWSLTLQELTTEQEPDTEWIEDQILYVASTPYGLDGGTDFALYLPDTPVEALSEELRCWWPGWMYEVNGQKPETLQCYGLCDLEAETGFFSWE